MLKIIGHNSTVLEGVTPELIPLEGQIFDFIRQATRGMKQNPTVRCCGGWVRDKLLPKLRPDVYVAPPDDIDMTVTNMTGIEFVDALEEFAISQFGEGQNQVKKLNVDFKTDDEKVKKIAAGQILIFGQDVDVVSLRKESWIDPETGERLLRNPIITPGSPWDDAFRRDLTINSLFYNLNNNAIEDFANGYDDIATLTLKTPAIPAGYTDGQPHGMSDEEWQYQESIRIFRDDPVRLLRVLRFFSRYSAAKLDPAVIEAMKDEKAQSLLTSKLRDRSEIGIVVENGAKEMRKIMIGEKPADAMRIMFQTGMLSQVLNLPESFSSLDMDQRNKYHQLTLINHTLKVIENVNNISKQFGLEDNERMMMNMTSLFHDLGKLDPRSQKTKPDGSMGYSGNILLEKENDDPQQRRMTHEQSSSEVWKNFASAFKLSNQEVAFVDDVISKHMQPHDQTDEGWLANNMPAMREFKDLNPRWKFIYLHAMADSMSKTETPDESRKEPYQQNIDTLEGIELPQLLNGNDIQQILNMKPGKQIGEILKKVRQEQYRNFGQQQELSFDEQKRYAVDVVKSFLPYLLDRNQVQNIVGLKPGRPPEGMPGYIQFVRDRIREEQLKNPHLSVEEAEQVVRSMMQAGELSPYS